MSNRFQERIESIDLSGKLLVASPNWDDALFGRTVCLIVHQGSEGSIGIVLNRTLNTDLGNLWKELAGTEAKNKCARVNFGGPMSGPVVAVHDQADLSEYESGDGVYLAAQVSNLKKLVADDVCHEVRIVVGQAGWQVGGLEQQFIEGKWLVVPVERDLVFAPEDEMWGRSLRAFGNHFVALMSGAILPRSAQSN